MNRHLDVCVHFGMCACVLLVVCAGSVYVLSCVCVVMPVLFCLCLLCCRVMSTCLSGSVEIWLVVQPCRHVYRHV